MTARIADRLLRACLRAYPAPRRERDGAVLLSLAHDLSSDGSALGEAAGLIRGGLADRLRIRWRGLVRAPWRPALRRLALPLAAIHLAVWATGIAGIFDPLPLGKWWTLVLGGSALALVGAALRRRAVAMIGSLGVLAALAARGLDAYLNGTDASGAHFSSYIGSTEVDLDSAMFPAALLLVLAAAALPRRRELSTPAFVRLVGAALPAVGLWLLARPGGPGIGESGGGGPGIGEPGGLLVAALLILTGVAVVWGTSRRRRDPVAGVLGAAILAVAAPEALYLLLTFLPYGGPDSAWDSVTVAVLFLGPLIASLACLALVGRSQATAD